MFLKKLYVLSLIWKFLPLRRGDAGDNREDGKDFFFYCIKQIVIYQILAVTPPPRRRGDGKRLIKQRHTEMLE